MMAKPVRGFQVNTILDRLALDMLGIRPRTLGGGQMEHAARV